MASAISKAVLARRTTPISAMCSLFLILEDVPIEKQGRLEPQDVKGSGSLYSQEGSQGGTRVREIHSKLLTDHEPSVSKLLETHYLELAPIGWQLFILGYSANDQAAS